MTKYILVYIQGPYDYDEGPYPGSMFEIDRYDTLEKAQEEGKKFKQKFGEYAEVLIMPYYSIE